MQRRKKRRQCLDDRSTYHHLLPRVWHQPCPTCVRDRQSREVDHQASVLGLSSRTRDAAFSTLVIVAGMTRNLITGEHHDTGHLPCYLHHRPLYPQRDSRIKRLGDIATIPCYETSPLRNMTESGTNYGTTMLPCPTTYCAWLPVQLAHLPNTNSCTRPDPPSSRHIASATSPPTSSSLQEQTRSPSWSHKPRRRLVTGRLNVLGFGFGFNANCLRQPHPIPLSSKHVDILPHNPPVRTYVLDGPKRVFPRIHGLQESGAQ
ncbi:hypothetical protein BGW80DRAFT_309676 [Lactifluus volemus]|nr:hypothetical protein BGW80DRAFT_309676 [Lactifluus volemus]